MRRSEFIGNLTKDPQLSYINMQTGEQLPVAHFSIAANEVVAGQKTVEYIDCSVFGKRAKPIMDYLRRGSSVYVDGVLTVKAYQKDDGSIKVIWRLTCDKVEFTGKDAGNTGSYNGQSIVQNRSVPESSGAVDMTEEFLRSGNIVPQSTPSPAEDVKLPWDERRNGESDLPF